jgi:hypothetical protein
VSDRSAYYAQRAAEEFVAAGRSETENEQGANRRCAYGFVDLLEQERTGRPNRKAVRAVRLRRLTG